MDNLSSAERSEQMSKVRSTNSKPEMFVRAMVHGMGYRYRLHRADLPGKPDLVFPGRVKVIFVHGCFWHRHGEKCPLTRMPKSRVEFWSEKLGKNRIRDEKNIRALRAAGWGVLILWECELRKPDLVRKRIERFLGPQWKQA